MRLQVQSRSITIIISNASMILTTIILNPIFTIPNIIPNIYQSYPYYNPNPNPIWTPTFPSFRTLFKKHLHPANSFSSYTTRGKQIFDLPWQVRSIFTSLVDLYPYHNHIRHNISLNTRHAYHFQPINTLFPGGTVKRQFR